MNNYKFICEIPFQAEGHRAAAAAQIAIFSEIRKLFARGFQTDSFVVPPLSEDDIKRCSLMIIAN